MRTVAFVVAAGLVAGPALAQQAWQRELGVQGGYVRVKPAGTGAADHADLLSLPGWGLAINAPVPGALFAIIPWSDKLAIEPSATLTQLAVSGATISSVTFGLRGNYALSDNIYAAAGGTLGYLQATTQHETQVGLQAALGYRLALTGTLNARLEARADVFGEAEFAAPVNTYAVLLGVSSRVGGRAGRSAGRAAAAGPWERALGVQASYGTLHVVGSGDLFFFSAPGVGSGLAIAGLEGLATPPTLFAILPLSGDWALQPGVDLHRSQDAGTTIFNGHVQARLAHALTRTFYAAGGADVLYVETTGQDGYALLGGHAAVGARFPLAGPVGGRFEASYISIGANQNLGDATNAFSLSFGATMPLR